jgi:hypothetical protein
MKRTLVATVLTFVLVPSAAAAAAGTSAAAAAAAPSATTNGATAHPTTATLYGTVNPNGAATNYYFEYGPTTAYGATSQTESAGSGKKALNVHIGVADLTPGTYHYRIVATNDAGTATGADRTFTTAGYPPPDVTTGPATAVDTRSAVITGTVTPGAAVTTYGVEYGPSTAYGARTAWRSLAAGSSPLSVSIPLKNLAHGTVFHYRLVARHGSAVVAYGTDQQFMTYTSPRAVAIVRARTRPRQAHRRPFVFTTKGRIAGPPWIPATYACSGRVRVRWYLGNRRIRQFFVPLGADCTFAARTVFRHRPGHAPRNVPVRLRMTVGYLGNGYLAPAHAAHPARITLKP